MLLCKREDAVVYAVVDDSTIVEFYVRTADKH